ncbi:hypothetical protein [Fluviicola taffensis]|uniref:Uncharacterized protein n=1 Tax=Fluviicola taffensis (strain DSM 16823 / NCIMB 13979 / RW262) TaxID=755732 RepID=F2IC40_FLUTR|nr:hypothetical protein [Fluviicola taffensis]AEA43266.1 hypothetical protein Fluta_1271 [Fluviicola taffensis DSM 16823]
MNFNGLNNLTFYFGLAALAIMLVSLIGILLGLKFRSIGYKIVVLVLSLGAAVLSYFCFRHEFNFPMIGSLFLVESFIGFTIIFVRKP